MHCRSAGSGTWHWAGQQCSVVKVLQKTISEMMMPSLSVECCLLPSSTSATPSMISKELKVQQWYWISLCIIMQQIELYNPYTLQMICVCLGLFIIWLLYWFDLSFWRLCIKLEPKAVGVYEYVPMKSSCLMRKTTPISFNYIFLSECLHVYADVIVPCQWTHSHSNRLLEQRHADPGPDVHLFSSYLQ